jgi:hypothetical protein
MAKVTFITEEEVSIEEEFQTASFPFSDAVLNFNGKEISTKDHLIINRDNEGTYGIYGAPKMHKSIVLYANDYLADDNDKSNLKLLLESSVFEDTETIKVVTPTETK